MPIQWYNGGILWKNGGIAFHADCCCGEVPPCTNLCGCCYSDDAVAELSVWPTITFDRTNTDITTYEVEERYDGYDKMIDAINAKLLSLGTRTLLETEDIADEMAGFTSFGDYGGPPNDVTLSWNWTLFEVSFTCVEVGGVPVWQVSIAVRTQDSTLTYENQFGMVGTATAFGCCGTSSLESTWTWTFTRNIGITPPSGDDPITLTNPQPTLTVSSNKCCADSETGECTHTGAEVCDDYSSDGLCEEEPI